MDPGRQFEWPAAVDGMCLTILSSLLLRSRARSPSSVRPLAPEVLERVTLYISKNLGSRLTVRGLASIARFSPSHFSRAFKAGTGLSPHRFIIEQRVERAKALLKDSSIPLVDVAYSAGFASQSHMTQLFRKHVGVAPGQWQAAIVNRP